MPNFPIMQGNKHRLTDVAAILNERKTFEAAYAALETSSPLLEIVNHVKMIPTAQSIDMGKYYQLGTARVRYAVGTPQDAPVLHENVWNMVDMDYKIRLNKAELDADQNNAKLLAGFISSEMMARINGNNAKAHIEAAAGALFDERGLGWFLNNGTNVAIAPGNIDNAVGQAMFSIAHLYRTQAYNNWQQVPLTAVTTDYNAYIILRRALYGSAVALYSDEGFFNCPSIEGRLSLHGNNFAEMQIICSTNIQGILDKLNTATTVDNAGANVVNELANKLNIVVLPSLTADTVVLQRKRGEYAGLVWATAGNQPFVKFIDPDIHPDMWNPMWDTTWRWTMANTSPQDVFLIQAP